MIKQIYDVIVVGGGPAGIMAATASARLGASTLLIEKNGFLGGSATAAVLGPISPFQFGDEQVIDGIPQEFVDRMVEDKGSTGHMKAMDSYGSGDYLCFYDREKYKYVAAEMLMEAGAEILYHSQLLSVQKEFDRVVGVSVVNKSGVQSIRASVVVDATGDGDVAVLAGENYSVGDPKTGKKQPSSAMFEMSNVDTECVRRYVLDHPQEFEWKSDIIPMREFDGRLRQEYFVAQGFKSLVNKAEERNELSFGRDSVLILNGIHPGSIHFNSTRVVGLDETDAEQRTKAELDGRRQIESVSEFMIQYVPGFEHAYVSVTNSEIGVRESRHIEGVYTLTGEDAYNGRKFKDVASRGYFPIDMHNPDGASGYTEPGKGGSWTPLKDSYDIPYRCFVPKHIDGLVLSGRNISGTSEAHGSFRTQGGIMGIGQASGVAAALSSLKGIQPRELDYKDLQKELIKLHASVFRDEEKKAREEAYADSKVKEYIESHSEFVTSPSVVEAFRKKLGI